MSVKPRQTILITGGAGFIGSALVRQLVGETDWHVVNVDKLTYAGNPESLAGIEANPNYSLEQLDICDASALERVFRTHQPSAVMHLAAESHVDRSIHDADAFIQTNVVGTHQLLATTRGFWNELEGSAKADFRFHHISTDEVYGDLNIHDPAFTENHPYSPSSPYSASKAASDHLVRAWHRTHGLPTLLTNCSNNYGPYQFPEKLIPLMALNAAEGKPLPVYGGGDNIRDWLYVEDHAAALRHVFTHGEIGRTYNIGGRAERTNLDVVRSICAILDELRPSEHGSHADLVQFVSDRPGHDRRYAIDDTRLATELNWHPQQSFESGLKRTIQWYLDNTDWVSRVRSGAYRDWIQAHYVTREAAT